MPSVHNNVHCPDHAVAALADAARSLLAGLDRLPDFVQAELSAGATLGELRGLASEQYDSLFDIACRLCNDGHFLDAAPLALQLVAHQPHNSTYAFMAGNCMQQLSLHANAVELFATCMALDDNNAAAAFRVGECLVAMDFMQEADRAFDAALALSRGDDNARELQDLVIAAMDMFRMPH